MIIRRCDEKGKLYDAWEFNAYDFADDLRCMRELYGLTQAGLAKKAGVSVCTVVNYENGYNVPKLSALTPIAAALGIKKIIFDTDMKWR